MFIWNLVIEEKPIKYNINIILIKTGFIIKMIK